MTSRGSKVPYSHRFVTHCLFHKCAQLQAENNGLKENIENLYFTDERLSEENQRLKEKIDNLSASNDKLRKENAFLLEREISSFDEMEKLCMENEVQEEKLAAVTSDHCHSIGELNDENTSLKERIESLEVELISWKTEPGTFLEVHFLNESRSVLREFDEVEIGHLKWCFDQNYRTIDRVETPDDSNMSDSKNLRIACLKRQALKWSKKGQRASDKLYRALRRNHTETILRMHEKFTKALMSLENEVRDMEVSLQENTVDCKNIIYNQFKIINSNVKGMEISFMGKNFRKYMDINLCSGEPEKKQAAHKYYQDRCDHSQEYRLPDIYSSLSTAFKKLDAFQIASFDRHSSHIKFWRDSLNDIYNGEFLPRP